MRGSSSGQGRHKLEAVGAWRLHFHAVHHDDDRAVIVLSRNKLRIPLSWLPLRAVIFAKLASLD